MKKFVSLAALVVASMGSAFGNEPTKEPGVQFKDSKDSVWGGSFSVTQNDEENKTLYLISFLGKDHLYLSDKGKLRLHDGIAMLGLGLDKTGDGTQFSFGLDAAGLWTEGYSTGTTVGLYGGASGEGALKLILNPAEHNRLMLGLGIDGGFNVTTPSFSMIASALVRGRLAVVASEKAFAEISAGGRLRMGIDDMAYLRAEVARSLVRGIDLSNSREATLNLDIKIGEIDDMSLMLGANVSVSKVDFKTAGSFADIIEIDRFTRDGGPVISGGIQFFGAPKESP